MNLKPCVIRIWYSQNGQSRPFEQGKIYQNEGKWIYLADMNAGKLWHNYNGYSIAKQITDSFSKLKLRPQIIYRRKDLGLVYITTLSKITGSKSILINYGGHQQWCLPLKNWECRQETIHDPHELLVIDLSKWEKGEQKLEVWDNGKWITL